MSQATPQPIVLLLSADLMLAARIAGATAANQSQLITMQSISSAVAACIADPVRLVVLDLRMPGIAIDVAVSKLRATRTPPPLLVACAPHVHAESLAAARAAGCDRVLSRGQIDRDINQIVAEL